jgi:transcriptional regulator with XRE-family HTH domain
MADISQFDQYIATIDFTFDLTESTYPAVENIGNRLKRFRLKLGLSQLQAAQMIGVAASTYRDWEYGKRIKGEPYPAIAKIFGVSISQLLTGNPSLGDELLLQATELERIVDKLRKTASTL